MQQAKTFRRSNEAIWHHKSKQKQKQKQKQKRTHHKYAHYKSVEKLRVICI